MANYVYNCASSKKNTGFTSFCEKIGLIKGYIITDDDVEFATETAAQTLANWTTLIQAQSIFPFGYLRSLENQSDEPTYEDTPFATELVTNGKMAWRFAHAFSQPSHKALFTHRGNSGRIILINEKGEIKGETTSDGKFRGFKLSLINIENLMLSDGSASEKTYLKVVLENADSVNRNIATVVPSDFSGLDLMGLIDIRLSESTASTSSITIEASIFATGETIDAFVEGDFTVLNSSGSAVTITTFTAPTDGSGLYQFDATFTAGDYTFAFNPTTMTTTGYDTPLTLTVTTS